MKKNYLLYNQPLYKKMFFYIIFLFIFHFFIRLSPSSFLENPLFLISELLLSVLYILLFVGWFFSLKMRIVQQSAKYHILALAFLAVFWLSIRTVKWYFAFSALSTRTLWYLYYLPIIFIPTELFMFSLFIGKSFYFKPKKKYFAVYIVSSLLFLIVLTNDFHNLFFVFKRASHETLYDVNNYTYAFLYYVYMVWAVLCIAGFLYNLIKNSKSAKKDLSFVLPLIPVCLSVIYSILYTAKVSFVFDYINDMTAFQLIMVMLMVEFSIIARLIPVNTEYKNLFNISAIPMKITDKNFETLFQTSFCTGTSAKLIKQAKDGKLIIEDGNKIQCKQIKGGYIAWKENISEAQGLLMDIEEIEETLSQRNIVLQKKYDFEKQRKSIDYKNALFDRLFSAICEKTDQMKVLIKEFEQEEDVLKEKTTLIKIIINGIYIKRRSNLFFSINNGDDIFTDRISNYLNEAFFFLEKLNIKCGKNIVQTRIASSTVKQMYDILQSVIERAYLFSIIYISISKDSDNFEILCEIKPTDEKNIKIDGFDITKEEDGLYLFSKLVRG